jgi:site-specific DNA recombinase
MKIQIANSACLYLRVSTEEQVRDAYGLESQERKCRELCQERGWEIVEVFRDAGVSGWADVERPEFHRMMAAIQKKRNVNLVFYDYSRFARRVQPALKAFEKLDSIGVFSIAATHPGIDCRTAAGRTARRDELSKAEDFSDQNSEATSARMKVAFEDGRFCRAAPLGYQNVKNKIKGQPNMVSLETEARLIVKSFELVHAGNSRAADVLRTVTALGLRSKKGNKLNLHTFLNMLRNPVYIGMVRSKKWQETRPGLHEAIVDERTFRNVQLILKGKKPIAAPYHRNRPEFPLRRFLRCSECGTPLSGGPSRSATGKKYDYYKCYKCRPAKSLPASEKNREFAEMLKRLRPDAALISKFPAVLKEEWQKRTGDNAAVLRKLNLDLQEKRSLQEKLMTAYLNKDKAILPVFEQMNRKFVDDIAGIENQIADAHMEKATFEELLLFSKSLLVDISTAWERADVDQKQRVQNTLFPNGLKYDPEKGILNSENDCLFNRLEDFATGKMLMARPERFELPAF